VGALEAFDPGATPWLGVTLKLEAHRRQLASDAASADTTALDRFVGLTPATVLQLLLPLVIIGLGFGLWTRERELGTLRQLAAQGVAPRRLFAGKTLGFLTIVALVAIPAAVGTAIGLGGDVLDETGAGRIVWLAGTHALWVLTWAGLTLAVSALSRNSRTALVALLALWGLVGLVGPRLVQDVAAAVAPVPDREAFARQLATSLKEGIPGGQSREERVEVLSKQKLKEAGFVDAATFMDEGLLAALELQAEAAYENEVINHHFAELRALLQRRENVARWLGFLCPYVAMRSVSAGLSGTDAAHHRDFADTAEVYRQALVDQLNAVFAEHAGQEGWDYKAGREVWSKAAPMAWTAPPTGAVIAAQTPALAALIAWCLASLLLGAWAVGRIKVVA
jgi:ABC-2 type transport system permease protein